MWFCGVVIERRAPHMLGGHSTFKLHPRLLSKSLKLRPSEKLVYRRQLHSVIGRIQVEAGGQKLEVVIFTSTFYDAVSMATARAVTKSGKWTVGS
jgi:hypothetical protein